MPSRVQQPSSNPYGGAVVLDSTPYLQLHLQKQTEEKAKQAAAQKAYEDLMKDPNPDGLREVDTKGFYDRANQWRQFGIQNKDFIKDPTKDNGAARNQFMKMANEISLYTQASKSRKEHEKQFAPLFQNPETAKRLKNSFLQQYGQLQSPLDNSPTFTFDPSNMFRAKNFDEKKFIETATLGEKPSETITFEKSNIPLKRKQITSISYADPKRIGENAKSLFKTDESAKEHIEDLWDAEGIKTDANGKIVRQPSSYINELNQVHQKYYGKPIQTAEDLAAAYGIQRATGTSRKEQLIDDEMAKMNYKQRLDRKMKEYEHDLKGMDENKQGIWVDNYIKNTLIPSGQESVTQTGQSKGKNSVSTERHAKAIPMSPIEAKALARDGQTPDVLEYDSQTNQFYPTYYRYKDGEVQTDKQTGQPLIREDVSQPLTYEQFKLSLIDAAPKNTQTVREMNKDVNIGGGKREVQSSTRSASQSGSTGKKAIPNF